MGYICSICSQPTELVLEAAVQLTAKGGGNEAAFQVLSHSTFFNNC